MKLHEACQHALTRWKGMRREALYTCWVEELLARFPLHADMGDLTLGEINQWVARMQAEGLSPATIYAKVSFTSVVYDEALRNGWKGTKPPMPYPHVPRVLKWWPNPDEQERMLRWCDDAGEIDLKEYLEWTLATGLRVEETLAVTRDMFTGLHSEGQCELMVPGLKTMDAQASLPLSEPARNLAVSRLERSSGLPHGEVLFGIGYTTLARAWRRYASGRGFPHTATLKAMRRAYARTLAGKGAPLPVIQQMMRHRDPATTMEYLRLTGGGFKSEEMRRYL